MWIRYYSSEFFGHAEGATVANAIMTALKNDNVPVPQLLTLGSDGPNVNKTIWRELKQKIRRRTQISKDLWMLEHVTFTLFTTVLGRV